MVLELRGVACIGLEEVSPDRKSLIASRSFGQAVETRRGLEEAVSVYTARAAEKMRRQDLATASLTVWIETNSFKPEQRQYNAGKLIAAAMAALGIIFKPGYRYKKAGVTFLDLAPSGRVQSGLFDQPDDARSVGRMRAIDQLNARFGSGTIGFGTAGERQAWSLRREFTSPRFTTDWNELLRV
jgi:DNA polymerase V